MSDRKITRIGIDQLVGRYKIARSKVYERMADLGIEQEEIGNRAYVSAQQIALLDELHEFIRGGGNISEFLARKGFDSDSFNSKSSQDDLVPNSQPRQQSVPASPPVSDAASMNIRIPVDQLVVRYKLARSAVYRRMADLGIERTKIGSSAYISNSQLALLDELHSFIQGGGSVAKFLTSKKIRLGSSSAEDINETTANEVFTLNACLLALLHYDDSLPAHLHEQIQTVRKELSDSQPEAIKHFKSVIEQDDRLKSLYIASRPYLAIQEMSQNELNLMTQYGQQKRAKSAIDLAIAILSGPDANYRAKAQQVLNQPKLQKQLETASQEVKAAAQEFAKAASQLHPTQVAMLKKIEGSFFTLDDIAYSLEIPIESAQRYGKALWNEGYIRPISSNLLKQLWWSFQGAPTLNEPPDVDTSLTLTAKGYFYLHPGRLGKKSDKSWRTV